MSYLSTSVRAVWAALKAGENVAAYMSANNGSWYEEDEDSKKALRITKSDCPAVIMVPAVSGLKVRNATNVSHDLALPLDFDLRVEDEDVDAIVDFWEMVVRDLQTAWLGSAFGLDMSVGLWNVEVAGARISKLYEDGQNAAVFVSWQALFAYTLVFRRDLTAAS